MRCSRLHFVKFALFGLVVLAAVGFAVMGLWNWLLPSLLGWRQISFAEALGVLVLSRLLFGGWRGHGFHGHWRRRFEERWARMTPEEQAKFRAGMVGRCGCFTRSEPDAGAKP